MGFESCFTLYRKYNTKVSDLEMKSIIKKYIKEIKAHDYSETNKIAKDYEKSLPLILNPNFGENKIIYDKKTKKWIDKTDHSINGLRKTFQFVLASDGSNLDELTYWHFCSNFNCLCEEFNLGHGINKNEAIIDRSTAEKMLQACNYLLNGKYSDDVEDMLDNKWIEIFANGNSGNSYWPYVYRNDKKQLNQIPESERTELKYTIANTKRALEAFLHSETSGQYDEDTQLILVYSISY